MILWLSVSPDLTTVENILRYMSYKAWSNGILDFLKILGFLVIPLCLRYVTIIIIRVAEQAAWAVVLEAHIRVNNGNVMNNDE